MQDRVRWLAAFRRLVTAARDELCDLAGQEVHKPYFEALTADVLPLLAAVRWHERYGPGVLKPRRAAGKPWFMVGQRARLTQQPLGTVAIIATWNYPVQLLGIQLVQAVCAGNRVIVKPSERAPRTQGRLMELALAAAADVKLGEGLIEVRPATRKAGADLLEDHTSGKVKLDHVVFTGSTAVGRRIAAWAAEHLVSTTLELSGCDSALVMADADPVLAARSIWHAATTNGGQTCMAPRRALVDAAVYQRFAREMGTLAAAARPRRLIDAAAAARCVELAQEAVKGGARPASGLLELPAAGDPAVLRPMAMLDCPAASEAVRGEHFGPLLAVVPTGGLEAMLAIHRRCGQHLSVSVYTRDAKGAAERIAPLLGASQVNINDSLIPTAIPDTAIAGHGESGWGASRGRAGLLGLSRPVAVSRTSTRIRTPLDAPDAKFVKRFSGFVGWMFR